MTTNYLYSNLSLLSGIVINIMLIQLLNIHRYDNDTSDNYVYVNLVFYSQLLVSVYGVLTVTIKEPVACYC